MNVEICWESQFPRHHFGQIYLHSVIASLTKSQVVLRTEAAEADLIELMSVTLGLS